MGEFIQRIVGVCVSILGFFIKPLITFTFSVFYGGRKGKVPPITNDILLESATSLATKIRKRQVCIPWTIVLGLFCLY
jgi:hypothetical protein